MDKRSRWFTKVRGSYLPASWQAWLLYIPYTAYCGGVVIETFSEHNSFLHALFRIVPNWVAALVIMTWIAERTSPHS